MTEFGELRFKIVGIEMAGQEVLARLSNLIVPRAAFDICVSLWPSAWIVSPAATPIKEAGKNFCTKKEPQ